MTVSMRVMSAREGYRYLLKSVVTGDGNRRLSTPLVDYYTAQGTPPGFWLGTGITDLGDGQLRPGDVVSEEQLQLLLGQGRDPVSGEALGRAFANYPNRKARISARVAALDAGLGDTDRALAIAAIEVEEHDRQTRQAVAGFDFTFSVPKSVSVLWAVADPDIQAAIVAAHHAAVGDVVRLMEREVAATRTGSTATDGAVAQVDVTGLIATAFDHYDSRAGDPQLHTHVVISNKVKTVWDGKWRSLDSRPLHGATVAMSEHYNAVLADRLTRTLGPGWEQRARGRDRNPAWELRRVPDSLVELFSSRSHDIGLETDRLIEEYINRHGHRPSSTAVVKLRAQATLATRPDKTVQSLADLTAKWRRRAAILGPDPDDLGSLLDSGATRSPVMTSDVPIAVVERIAHQVVEVVGEKRSTWRRWNLHAEVSRQTIGLRFANTQDREALVDRVVDAAEAVSLRLTPPDLATVPAAFTRADGTSMFRPKHSIVFTSAELLEAEDRLLNLGRQTTGPSVPLRNLELAATMASRDGQTLGDDQVAALTSVGTSRRVVDVLVGPAGAGKTTAMSALRNAWELSHGPGSVVGLAPSAAAAEVLADDLDIGTDNTAKWLHDYGAGHTRFKAGQLVIIDEASLAGTRTLDRISGHAAEVGAKVLLVGDWAQLAAVEAGGAFGMLVRDHDNPPELIDVHRFHHDWEKQASLQLRNGNPDAIDTYQSHDRIQEGDSQTMRDGVYRAWRDDLDARRSSLMIAQSRDTVTALNTKARKDRILRNQVDPAPAVRLHDHTLASTGDIIITRRNNRHLLAGKGWVKNGDRWIISAINDDASISVRKTGRNPGASVQLPADYVADHVELGYAVTAHRAQGATVDTSHTLVEPGMTRETLYVAMTRGRHTNTAHVATDQPNDEEHHQPDAEVTAQSVLDGVLRYVGAEQSVREIVAAQQDRWSTIAQLAAEYETIAATAQHHRWVAALRQSGLTQTQADDVIGSDAFGPLCALLRQAEAHHHDPDALLSTAASARPLDSAHDIAAVLHGRIRQTLSDDTNRSRPRRQPHLIVGLIPQATGPMDDDVRQALDARRHLIEQRAHTIVQAAINTGEPWLAALGDPPRDVHHRRQWLRHVTTVAAYRDRYTITTDTPLGPPVQTAVQATEAARARAAVHGARNHRQLQPGTTRGATHAAPQRGRSL